MKAEKKVPQAFAFDTLSCARHLREHGIPQDQAESHADAVRQFVMAELVTKTDLQVAVEQTKTALDHMALRLTVRFGVMIAAGITILGAFVKLT